MRTVVLKDHLIDKDECLALLDEYSKFIEKHTGIKCEWYVEGYDFSRVPTVPDSDGDLKPTREYRKSLETDVHNRYGDYGVDNIVMWVHEKNFVFKGVWGTNWSYNFYKYSFQLCRWDKDNPANSFGTLYHEQAHSFDAVCMKEIGFDVRNTLGVLDYDRDVVHGKSESWDYIRYQENTLALNLIAPYLTKAYQSRKDKHLKKIGLMEQLIKLLSTLVDLLSRRK